MTDQHKDIYTLLLEVLEQPTAQDRAAYMDKVCQNNPGLRTELESLLRAHEQAGSFLEVDSESASVTMDQAPLTLTPGTVIGPYKLLEKIGEGGMAVVYMAEQERPLRRRVALKIDKLGMDTKQVIARFEAERQALAMMDHPNIAKVFDAGAMDTGRPYFVMELVRGISITDYCDKNMLSTRERLDLFVQVCHAVQHAHQKGIIHRDIKPSNILVTLHEGNPLPMVIDFGIAKATNQRLTEQTVFTQHAQMIGTPEYMSPEQAEMGHLDIDTRTDIYSLGVLLYELLTGTLPFGIGKLLKAGYLEIQRIIREEEADKPSTRLSSMGEAATEVARHRKANPELLAKLIRGDLDWIVMKSLEKDRARRYGTPTELAADIERHFNNEPVQAAAPSLLYQAQKFFRRHQVSVTAGILVAAALVVGLAVSTTMYFEAEDARSITDQQRQVAETERDNAREAERLETLARNEAERAQQAEQKQRQFAEQKTEDYRRLLYFDRINLAEKYYDDDNVSRVRDLLTACPNDLRSWEWYYLWHLSDQAQMTLHGHEGAVSSVAFSPDGKRIISGSRDNTLQLWDASSGSEVMILRGHEDAVTSVAFSPDGQRIVSGSSEGTLRLWDSESGSEMMTLRGHEAPVVSVAFSPDGQRIASGSSDKTLKVWDSKSGDEVTTLHGHDSFVTPVAFSPDSRRIVSGNNDNTIRIWDADSGNEMMTLKGQQRGVLSVAFSRDGRKILSVSPDATIKVWDADSGSEMMTLTLKGHQREVSSVAFSPDGRKIVSGSWDTTIKVWDADSGSEIMTLKGHQQDVLSVAFSPDGRRIVSGSGDNTLKVWDADRDRKVMALRHHRGSIWSVAFSPNGKRIASGGADGTLKLWNTENSSEIRTFRGHEDIVASVAFTPGGKHIVSGSMDKTLKLWDANGGREQMTLRGHEAGVSAVAFSPDGTQIVSSSHDRSLKIWDTGSGSELITLQGHRDLVVSTAFSPDGRRIVSSSRDGTCRIWDANSGNEVMVLRGPEGYVWSVAFSPDG
ncbi:MAG: protein kinase, partial [Planctomycetes bacterium]|nr:protein kinase [Planctomycetota bacterium]